ncbi:N-acetylglucosamine 6-phosphate deacetylase [Nocardioides sp. Root1257]|uniref:N-acetylglucosamine-6-phosphate deacetylase n=1 Tax=unclassified Nocardioides TaxID=2615069 RepID=UPI0006F1EF2E|nr:MULTISPECIES: amidohydrolase family protein [unclassified Nocardioides]KQW47869.1 N-acetylglucosamine 6-phosphate deacetylase [Nocardioides sp. Root1257]KRC45121.1 N-acetylglucosamine 6-phosphate deacetylase [Nocardioides sp. Root224]
MSTVSGLVDLQVNGAAGIDLTAEPHRLWEVASVLPAYGVVAFVPTVITSDPAARRTALDTLAAGPPAGWTGAEPLGLHFEGPMIAPSRKGAHPEHWLRPPSLDLVDGWSRESGVVMATIAPELPGALEVIERLVAEGVVVSVGHTAAGTAEVAAAVEAGARCVTHLGNAMAPVLPRDPGPVGTALGGSLGGEHLVAGVIVDGHHLDPLFVRMAWRALGPDRFLSVSDTTAGLGLPDGPARLGDQDVVVSDGTVRLHDGTLAGSAASLLDCLRTLVAQTGCSVEDALTTATTTPLTLLGLPPREERIELTDDLELL